MPAEEHRHTRAVHAYKQSAPASPEKSAAGLLGESDSDAGKETKIDELMQRSLEDALQRHAEETGARPEDVVILQVADEQSSTKELTGRERSGLKSKTMSSRELSASRDMSLVQAPHAQSHASTKSRVNTAENVGSSEAAAAVTQTVPYAE